MKVVLTYTEDDIRALIFADLQNKYPGKTGKLVAVPLPKISIDIEVVERETSSARD